MAVLRYKDVIKLDAKERKAKLSDLRMELVKANVTVNKTNAKTKEIKRAISRILMFNAAEKSGSVNHKEVSKK